MRQSLVFLGFSRFGRCQSYTRRLFLFYPADTLIREVSK